MGVWNELIQFTLFQMGTLNSKVEPSSGKDCVWSSRFNCIIFWGVSLYIQKLTDIPVDCAISFLKLNSIPSCQQRTEMETVCCSEMSVTLYHTARYHIPKYSTPSIMSKSRIYANIVGTVRENRIWTGVPSTLAIPLTKHFRSYREERKCHLLALHVFGDWIGQGSVRLSDLSA